MTKKRWLVRGGPAVAEMRWTLMSWMREIFQPPAGQGLSVVGGWGNSSALDPGRQGRASRPWHPGLHSIHFFNGPLEQAVEQQPHFSHLGVLVDIGLDADVDG